MSAPNPLRIVLILLSIASFYPQCARILMRQDSGGVSPSYALCNVIVATHQFSLDLFFIVTSDEADLVIHRTPSVGDWLNLIQFAVVCVGHFIIFVSLIVYPPTSLFDKVALLSTYLAFILVSVVPVIFIASLPPNGHEPDGYRRWPAALFGGLTTIFVAPAMTALAIASFFPQARELRSRGEVGAVSVWGLAAQAVVFFAVGITWVFRWKSYLHRVGGSTWYQLGGWSVLNNLVFAVVQGGLWIVAKNLDPNAATADADETSPLLS